MRLIALSVLVIAFTAGCGSGDPKPPAPAPQPPGAAIPDGPAALWPDGVTPGSTRGARTGLVTFTIGFTADTAGFLENCG